MTENSVLDFKLMCLSESITLALYMKHGNEKWT